MKKRTTPAPTNRLAATYPVKPSPLSRMHATATPPPKNRLLQKKAKKK